MAEVFNDEITWNKTFHEILIANKQQHFSVAGEKIITTNIV
jgi:hypothetical protein